MSEIGRSVTHVLMVTHDVDDEAVCDINHGDCTERGHECMVEGFIADVGLDWGLLGSFPKEQPKPGRYEVQAWCEKFDVPGEPIDYDMGLDVLAGPS